MLDGKVLVAPNVGVDDTIDSDAIGDTTTSEINGITVVGGQDTPDNDAGVEYINTPPNPQDDDGKICYFDPITIDVLANDTDLDGDTLTITQVDGQAITDGGPAVNVGGVLVSLVGGMLVFDGSVEYDYLLTGEEALHPTISYTVTDGTVTATAGVDVIFCGATDTLDKVKSILPATVQMQVIDENSPADTSSEAWTVKITDATALGLLDGIFDEAYCLSAFADIKAGAAGTNIMDAPLIDVNVHLATKDALVDAGVDSLSAAALDNLDLVNWILNQDFTSLNNDGSGIDADDTNNYTDGEVQGAIWALTDGLDSPPFVADGAGTATNAAEILAEAQANGEGFEANAANGDLVGVFLDPADVQVGAAIGHEQPFIIAYDLYEDCDCG